MTALVYAVENLVIDLYTPTVSVRAVDGVSFAVHPGETLHLSFREDAAPEASALAVEQIVAK